MRKLIRFHVQRYQDYRTMKIGIHEPHVSRMMVDTACCTIEKIRTGHESVSRGSIRRTDNLVNVVEEGG